MIVIGMFSTLWFCKQFDNLLQVRFVKDLFRLFYKRHLFYFSDFDTVKGIHSFFFMILSTRHHLGVSLINLNTPGSPSTVDELGRVRISITFPLNVRIVFLAYSVLFCY